MSKIKDFWQQLRGGNKATIKYTVGTVAIFVAIISLIIVSIVNYVSSPPEIALADSSVHYDGTIKGKTRSGATVFLEDKDGYPLDQITTKSGEFSFKSGESHDSDSAGYDGESGKYFIYATLDGQHAGKKQTVKVEEDDDSDVDYDYYYDSDDEDEEDEEEEKDDSEYDSVSYDELARNPEDYENESVTLSGQVMQVQNSDDGCIVLLWQNDDSDQLVMVYIDDADFPENGKILEDDEITIYGYASGTKEYDTVSGASNEVPLIYVDKTVVDSGKSSNAF